MPWQCNDCATEIADDQVACPSCASPKTSWTMVAEHTRTFVLSGRRFQLKRGRGSALAEAPPPADALVDADVVYALTKTKAQAIHAAGKRPPSRSLLTVRLFPRKRKDWSVLLEVNYETDEVAEHAFPRDADSELDPEGHVDAATFVFVYGPETLDEAVAFEGIHLLDVSEETDLGHAPTVDVSALGKPPQQVPVRPEPSFYLAARFLDATGHVPLAGRAFTVEGQPGETDEHGVAVLPDMPLKALRVVFEDGEVHAPPMCGPTMVCNVFAPFFTPDAAEREPHLREERWSWEEEPTEPGELPDWFAWEAEPDDDDGDEDDDDGAHGWDVSLEAEELDEDEGLLAAQLFDAEGEEPLAGRRYTIRSDDDAERFEGTLSARGELRHDDVPPGDYTLEVDGVEQTATLLVLDPGDEPLIRYLA